MSKNIISFLYAFDIIGIIPNIYIFNNKRYKSLLTLTISL